MFPEEADGGRLRLCEKAASVMWSKPLSEWLLSQMRDIGVTKGPRAQLVGRGLVRPVDMAGLSSPK